MKRPMILKFICIITLFIANTSVFAQLKKGVYITKESNIHHEIKVNENYLVYSIYEKAPAKFIKTIGGFYTIENNTLQIKLEFNSDYQKDSLRTLTIPIQFKDDDFVLDYTSKKTFQLQKVKSQDLDGQWLFASRGPDTGQKRRDDTNARKTLKFLINSRFQWIAYNTETFKFSGTGGGRFTSKDGIYTENIEYFSKDNNRVGASLEFNYELKENDWHHTGMNSKGKPMYEIWEKRVSDF